MAVGAVVALIHVSIRTLPEAFDAVEIGAEV
jgi:hypothetical protein